jgi:DNA-binding MarR family transcriptional regulator
MSEGNKQLPIGYWLKRADELLTKRIDEVQRANGLTSLGWQVLNVVRDKRTAMHDEIADTLRPFADAAAVGDVLTALAGRGLISGSAENRFELTPAGSEFYGSALRAQQAIRQRAVAGISETEYAMTVGVIQRLVDNLERDEPI